MGLKLEKHDGKWMIRSEGQLRLAFFKLKAKDWSLACVDVPYSDLIDDDPDNHSLTIDVIIDRGTFMFDIAWDGEITRINEVYEDGHSTLRSMLIIPSDHGVYDFIKPFIKS